jgi:hypothetical protein
MKTNIHVFSTRIAYTYPSANQVFTADKKWKRNLHISPRSSLTAGFHELNDECCIKNSFCLDHGVITPMKLFFTSANGEYTIAVDT